jgi:phosphoribosylglycinamide formyltransferase-1
MSRRRVGVLISGRGSNLQALLDAAADPAFPAEIAVVLSNVAGVQGLERARRAGVAEEIVPHGDFTNRQDFEAEVSRRLEAQGVELVCLAGFMRVLTPWFIERWPDRLINIHPSLLPAFPGLDTHARALAAGVKLHGCSVHFVRAEVDAGPIIGQAAVPVHPDDDEARLAARVLAAEHRLYPRCLALVARGDARLDDERVVWPEDVQRGADACLINPATAGAPDR